MVPQGRHLHFEFLVQIMKPLLVLPKAIEDQPQRLPLT